MKHDLKTIYILHSFNGRPYFEAVEYFAKQNGYKVEYRETNFIKSIVKLFIGSKCINCNLKAILNNIKFCLKVPLITNETIIYGTAPYDYKFLWYSLLRKKNNFIYHTSHHKWGDGKKLVFSYGPLNIILRYLWKKILDSDKTKIVAVTKASKLTLETNFLANKTVFQIYHSIDINRFLYKEKNIINKKLNILYVGRFVYEKGLDTIAKVVNSVDSNKFNFTLVGDGEYKQKIEHLFEKDNVNYMGWVSDKNKLAKIYATQDILLNPSIKYKDWEELFGLVNIEAMATGMVVIASNHIGPKEIISNTKDGFLIEEKDAHKIVQILNNLYDDRSVLGKLSLNAQIKAKNFSIYNIAKQWERAINEQ